MLISHTRRRRREFAAALALALCALLGCMPLAAAPPPAAPAALAAAPAASASLAVEDAWIRWLPADLPAAGYLKLSNTGGVPAALIGASSPAYSQVSLHRSLDQGGRMQMQPVERITIGAHSSLDFEASGYHMMLMQATRPLKPADHVPITLHFADGSTLLVQFEVRKPDGE